MGPGGADTRHKSANNPTTKTIEVLVQEGPSQRQPPRLESVKNTLNSQLKSNSVSVAISTCIHTSHVVNCLINNNPFHSTLSLPTNSASQWVQEKFVPNSPPQHRSSTGCPCMALTNCKQNNIRPLGFRGNIRVQDRI